MGGAGASKLLMEQVNGNARRLWPSVSIGLLAILTIAAAAGSGLEYAGSKTGAPLPQVSKPRSALRGPVIDPGGPCKCSLGRSPVLPPAGTPPPPRSSVPPTPPRTRSPGCESSLSAAAPSLSRLNPDPRNGLADALVPTSPSAPLSVTICRYAGLNQQVPAGDLERSRVLGGSQLAGLVAYVDDPGWETVSINEAFSCPMSIGSVDVMRFVYSSGPGVTLSVDINGCPFVSNGQKTVWGGAIGQRLAEYVGTDSFPG
jgi:hypothetical protein